MKLGSKQEIIANVDAEASSRVLVSVAMPVYNTASCALNRAVNSILSQTHENLELLIVDDGSNSSCRDELKKIAQQDSRVKLLSGDHLGVSHARNVAIDAANGEWIAFCDADDEVASHFVEESLAVALVCEADFVCGCMTSIYPGQEKRSDSHSGFVFSYADQSSLENAARQMLGPTRYRLYEGPHFGRGPVAKLIRKKALGNLRFDENLSLAEDVLFNYRMILSGGILVIVDTNWYWYYQNANSSVRDTSVDFWKTAITSLLGTMIGEDERPSYLTRLAYISQQAVENFIRCKTLHKAHEQSVDLLRSVKELGCFYPPIFEGYEPSPWTRAVALFCRLRWYTVAFLFLVLKVRVADFVNGRKGLFDATESEVS